MAKKLVIVESPAKAKTISKYLGPDYHVEASMGHIRDLPQKAADLTAEQKKIPHATLGVNIDKNFEPLYIVPDDKKDRVKKLKNIVKKSDDLYIATDEDREGEAIGWHLVELLAPKQKDIKRIVFHEITKKAITHAVENPRTIDADLVNAQQARRVLDRLVGYGLSPLLWKKVQRGLSAGRVQSVAVRIIVDREREIEKFDSQSAFKITAEFLLEGGKILKAELGKKFKSYEKAEKFLESCKGAEYTIEDLQTKPGKKSPSAPFTTSTLQQEASRKLGYQVGQTMRVAQKLYEAGKITYMRTDSLNLSEEAIAGAAKEISSEYGDEYIEKRKYKTKSDSAQEAHEAIRPTDFSKHTVGGDNQEQKLYELIWKRAIASQMADAKLEKTTATIGISTNEEKLVAKGEVVKFEGFLKVYIESNDDEDDEEQSGMLPPLTIGEKLKLDHIKALERFSRPPARFTEASLVKKMEEMGIGRPSTYAPTISTIQKRGYVVKESRDGREREYTQMILKADEVKIEKKTEITGAEKNKLFPTNTGFIVTEFLVKHFENVVDYSFTAKVEEDFDSIAEGKIAWPKMIGNFYGDFSKLVGKIDESVDRSESGGSRDLGVDPKSGKPVSVRLGRYGPFVQIGDKDDEEKPKFASLLKGQLIEKITLEEALELFKLPRTVGKFEDEDMIAAIGRFGPYIKHKSKFYSLGQEHDPMTVSEETSIEIIKAKREADAKKVIKEFKGDPQIRVLNGRWGPYISFDKKNYKIPKDIDPAKLTKKACEDIIKNPPKARGKAKAKTPAKKKAKS